MDERSRDVTLLLLFLSLFVGQSRGQEACGSDLNCTQKTVEIGVELALLCNGCQGEVEWSKCQGTAQCFIPTCPDNDGKSNVYTVQSITIQDGGIYQCKCASSSVQPQCFNVTVAIGAKITTFEAKPSTVRVNSSFTLVCTAVGLPAPTRFLFFNGGPKFKPEPVVVIPENRVSSTAEHTVIANSSEGYSGKYECSVTTPMGTDFSSTYVTVYEPPSIVNVKNFSAGSFSRQRRGFLECTVHTGNISATSVLWIHTASGHIIQPDDKYSTSVRETDEDGVFVYVLEIQNLQESDVGGYICLLSSNGITEDSRVVLVTDTTEPTDYSGSGENPSEKCNDSCWGKIEIAGTVAVTVVATIVGMLIWPYMRRCINCGFYILKTKLSGKNPNSGQGNGTSVESGACENGHEQESPMNSNLAMDEGDDVEPDGANSQPNEEEESAEADNNPDAEVQVPQPQPFVAEEELEVVVYKGVRKRRVPSTQQQEEESSN